MSYRFFSPTYFLWALRSPTQVPCVLDRSYWQDALDHHLCQVSMFLCQSFVICDLFPQILGLLLRKTDYMGDTVLHPHSFHYFPMVSKIC